MRGVRSTTMSGVSAATASVLALVVLAAAALATITVGLDARVLTVTSGSMSPALEAGDAVVVRLRPSSEVARGDIITFRPPEATVGETVTHRVSAVERAADGRVAFETQGDANKSVDPWLIKPDGDATWVVVGHASHLGRYLLVLADPMVIALGLAAGAIAALMVMARIWSIGSGGSSREEVQPS